MGELLKTPITVIHVIACLFLMLTILIQPGKSGGMGALTGAGAQQVFGGRGAGNFLTRITWATATIFFVTSITLAFLSTSTDESLLKRSVKPTPEKVEIGQGSPKPASSK
ncbi:MAG: preprotein translocase subunit SecG [Polyangiaceae bacterium]